MQVGLESFARFQNLTSAQYDFRPKLRDTNFNYHFSYGGSNSKFTRHYHNNRIEDQTRSERDTNVTIAKRIKLKVHETLT